MNRSQSEQKTFLQSGHWYTRGSLRFDVIRRMQEKQVWDPMDSNSCCKKGVPALSTWKWFSALHKIDLRRLTPKPGKDMVREIGDLTTQLSSFNRKGTRTQVHRALVTIGNKNRFFLRMPVAGTALNKKNTGTVWWKDKQTSLNAGSGKRWW